MIEIFGIFLALVLSPFVIALPFYIVVRKKEKREKEAQAIVDKLRGLKGPVADWFTGF